MVKRNWSPEERKAFGEKMKQAREAKRQPQVKATQAERPGNMEPSITAEAFAQGITLPANADKPHQPQGQLIPQLSDNELYAELEYLTLEDFVRRHTDMFDANVDAMARVTRLSRDEIMAIQRELGYALPEGA